MTVRVAVVGCGWWSTYAHLPALAEHPDAEIAALVDPDPERLAAAATAFGDPPTFTDVEAMLDAGIDAAIIAVPHALHHPVARAVLDRGVAVLLEKPMVLDPAHGRELIALAEQRGAHLVIGYPWQYNRHVLELRELVTAGGIGPIEHVSVLYASTVRELYKGNPEPYRDLFGYPVSAPSTSTYSDPQLAGGGQGQTQLTHAAALLLWLTGLRIESVAAFTSNAELAVDLADAVAVRFAGGAVGTLSTTGSVTPGEIELVRFDLFGRDGHVQLDINHGTASVHRSGTVEHLPPVPAAERDPVRSPARNLVELVAGTAANGSPADVGLGSVELVRAMYDSAAEGGKPVRVSGLP
ncbi:Gfo/Idh/MocA family protein [Pseudonocardia sp. CA-107938]|uniref:Gfo/Idh/MocA family protein n=1 Tax=Pseudonocardia sp. CA-107938 TaxID=3240021 RepID=UPI003D8E60B1